MDNKVMLVTNTDIQGYATNMYIKGVTDGFGYAIGTYILYRFGKFFVNRYIGYKVEKGIKEGSAK